MEPEGFERKLVAVLAADVAGYSRMMGADEDATMAAWWSARKEVIDPMIAKHRGRIVKHTGDGFLAEFPSVDDAVRFAVGMQTEMARRNADLPSERRMDFRVGVNLCDIMADDEDIYGDGVNIAARVEVLAEPGGICVTAAVRDQTRNMPELTYRDLGQQTVKNIAEPIGVFRIGLGAGASAGAAGKKAGNRRGRMALVAAVAALAAAAAVAWFAPWAPPDGVASEERMAFPLPDKPSVAVLPFDNLSADPGEGYIADGITENIITTLSQVSNLFVIARNSIFVYKGKPVKVQRVAEDLGVRYVLEGSVQKAGGKVRINAQLIDALSGTHLWAERYDRELEDLFAVQDEITREIVTALQVELTEGEQVRVWRRHTSNMEAWRYLTQGVELLYRFEKGSNAQARRLFGKAIEADQRYALGHALIAWTHWMDIQHGWSESPDQSFRQALELAQKALALDDSLPDAHSLLGAIQLLNGDHEQAVREAEKAVALNPNHATNTALLAMILHNAGRLEEAIRGYKRAMRLSPYYPDWFLEDLGFTYFDAGRLEEALVAFEKFIGRGPSPIHVAHAHLGRALAFAALGRDDEGRAEIPKAVAADSKLSAPSFGRHSLNKDQEGLEIGLATLIRLGLPE